MEGSSSQPSDSDRKPPAAAASFLANLPSRGLFSSTVSSSNPGGMRVYVCEHDTSPPANQRIKTNLQNILIRSLTLKKRGDSSSKDGRAADKKRPAERVLDSRTAAKRANAQTSSHQEGANSCTVERDYHSLTVERLRTLLKGKGLSVKGKKDELIARLRNASG